MAERLLVVVDERPVEHRGPGPFAYRRAGQLDIVVNGAGVNFTRFPDYPGAVAFEDEAAARKAADALNAL